MKVLIESGKFKVGLVPKDAMDEDYYSPDIMVVVLERK